MRNGNVYVLTGDMPNSSIVVKRDNIVIDGSGYRIHGYGTGYYDGIIISYRTNVTIKNMNISPFGYGVRMD
jgi:5-formyltetrahydrofolate cyclo-ligase